ncbi:MAG: flagellar biosynthesis protein FlgA [Pseudonocardiales bacterium]|nr:flagellar biosynthesis protein FlgA [Pseudonocardiales bacterium]PZS31333.1 MAG: flagellar biosynthesis protein FlgA [Pseudonocardiales bacterium]
MEPRQHRRNPRALEPVLRQWWEALARRSGFGRTLLLRRVIAAMLVGLAAVLALTPGRAISPDDAVVVAARDLAAGTVLEPGLVTLRGIPEQVVPDGAARNPSAVLGRTLAAPVRRGELLTDVRLTGSDLARTISTNPDTVSVSLRLADPGVATLLRPGATVDVVTVGERQDEPVVLARGARVLAVLEAGTHAGERASRLVLVALDPVSATRVAAASISQTLTVTFR